MIHYIFGRDARFCVSTIFFLLLSLSAFAKGKTYRTEILAPNYKTLQIGIEGSDFFLPVLPQTSEDHIEISFDEMSRQPQDLAYTVIHCNADWTKSELDKIDYMEGFDGIDITDFDQARNTTFDYTHYQLLLPNDDIKLTLSGNYAVLVYDKSAPENTLLCATFSISEDILPIEASVSSSTPNGVNTKWQQLNFSLGFSQTNIAPTPEEVVVVVRQNSRKDNQAILKKPTYLKGMDFVYSDDARLVFEGGTEYHRIDFSHRVNYSGEIEQIRFYRPYYHVTTYPAMKPETSTYNHKYDENGKFKVNEQGKSYLDIDYSVVHFTYKTDELNVLLGKVYVSGDFNYGYLDEKNQMIYNNEAKEYRADIVLKNGGYNYQFVWTNGQTSSIDILSGSHWQTENEYTIYVYYRKFGGLYDRLIAVHNFNYNK